MTKSHWTQSFLVPGAGEVHHGTWRLGYRANSPLLCHRCWLVEARLKMARGTWWSSQRDFKLSTAAVGTRVRLREGSVAHIHIQSKREGQRGRGITLPAHQPLFTSDTHIICLTHSFPNACTQTLSSWGNQGHILCSGLIHHTGYAPLSRCVFSVDTNEQVAWQIDSVMLDTSL